MGGIKGVESVAAAAAYELGLEARLETVLNSASRALIYEYCVVVVVANWLMAVPLFVVAVARLSN